TASRVSMRRSSSSGSGASGNCGSAVTGRRRGREVARAARGPDNLLWADVPLVHTADELQRVEEGRVVLRADLGALGHDAVGLGVHRTGHPLRRGELAVLGRLARRVGALTGVFVVEP